MKIKEAYTSTRIWIKTLKKLRIIAAYEDKSIVQVLESFAEYLIKSLGINVDDQGNIIKDDKEL